MRISEAVRRGWSQVLDLVYPPVCHPCGEGLRHGRSLCDACFDALPRLKAPFCQTCGEEFPGNIDGGASCPNCRRLDFAFDFARPAFSNDPKLREMIHGLKYLKQIELGHELGRLALEAFADPRLEEAMQDRWPLVPVPLHPKRERERHFNQAAEIVRGLSSLSGLDGIAALVRTRATDSQVRLTRAERLKNLGGAFTLSKTGRRDFEKLQRGVVLIDDVFTTGATTHECARTLVRAGVQKVVVVTVMRG